jgi:hypothetical protein
MGKVFFFLPLERNRGGGLDRGGLPGGGQRPSRERRRPGSGLTERGGRGRPIPVLTSGGDGLGREIDGRRRAAVEAAMAAAVGSSGGRWRDGKLRGAVGRGAGPFSRRGKAVESPGLRTRSSFSAACQWRFGRLAVMASEGRERQRCCVGRDSSGSDAVTGELAGARWRDAGGVERQ